GRADLEREGGSHRGTNRRQALGIPIMSRGTAGAVYDRPTFWLAVPLLFLSVLFTSKPLDASVPCADRGFEFFEQQRYAVRNVSIAGFFPLKRSLKIGSQLTSLEGKPFSSQAVLSQQSDLRSALRRAPSLFDSPVGVTVIGVRLVNCTDAGASKELDIEYSIFTT